MSTPGTRDRWSIGECISSILDKLGKFSAAAATTHNSTRPLGSLPRTRGQRMSVQKLRAHLSQSTSRYLRPNVELVSVTEESATGSARRPWSHPDRRAVKDTYERHRSPAKECPGRRRCL